MSGRANERINEIVDDGCEVASSCFDCPLPACKYDHPNAVAIQRAVVQARYDKMVACCSQGMSDIEIAARFNVCVRTVQRAISRWKRVA